MNRFQRKSYKELWQGNSNPTYASLLNTHEWEAFRKPIINRDKKCIRCGVILHGDDNSYYRSLIDEETIGHGKEWNELPGIDLLGDGKWIVKGANPKLSGIRQTVQVHHKYYIQIMLP